MTTAPQKGQFHCMVKSLVIANTDPKRPSLNQIKFNVSQLEYKQQRQEANVTALLNLVIANRPTKTPVSKSNQVQRVTVKLACNNSAN